MTDDEERYREAVRRAQRAERLRRSNAALLAYAEAAAAAPDKAAPYVAMGSLHLAAGRGQQAVDAFDAALRRAPRDEASLRGRADALVLDGRRAEAASALDDLATICESEGRLVEAMVAVRKALEMAESRPRRRALTDLVAAVRTRVIAGAGGEAVDVVAELQAAESLLGVGRADTDEIGPEEIAEALTALDDADRAVTAGDHDRALASYLAAARGLAATHLRDVELHLTLAEIYARAGWSEHLDAKVRVLGRFLEVEPDEAGRARLASIASDARA
jgi:tetratricopeptide (TPR) repeat protein